MSSRPSGWFKDYGFKGNIWVIWGLYRGYIGIVEKKMETTILGFKVYSPP